MEVVRVPKIFSPRVLIRDSHHVDSDQHSSGFEPPTRVTLSLLLWESSTKASGFSVCGCRCDACEPFSSGSTQGQRIQLGSFQLQSPHTYLSHEHNCQDMGYFDTNDRVFESQTLLSTDDLNWEWDDEQPQDLTTSSNPKNSVSPAVEVQRADNSPVVAMTHVATSFDAQKIPDRFKNKTKVFRCPYCVITCSNRGQLQGHIRIHTGERPFVCREQGCKKAFIRNEELTRHRRIHTGERPYVCEHCNKSFTRKDHLNKHVKIHSATDEIFIG